MHAEAFSFLSATPNEATRKPFGDRDSRQGSPSICPLPGIRT